MISWILLTHIVNKKVKPWWYCTSALHHTVLQYLLHPDGHVRDILGDSLDPLHQAGWLKPVDTKHLDLEWRNAGDQDGQMAKYSTCVTYTPGSKIFKQPLLFTPILCIDI